MATASPENPVASLEQVLGQEIALYDEFSTHLTEDTKAMIKLDLQTLEKNNKAKNTLILRIRATDQARQNLVAQIAGMHSIQGEKIRIQDICTALSLRQSEKLMALRDKLLSVRDRIRDIQEENKLLANSSLAWINGSMAALNEMLDPAQVYDGQGKVSPKNTYAGKRVVKQV